MREPIYLDYNATTPVAPEVLDVLLPALRDLWGNPSSVHAYGRAARAAVDRAREQVAALVGSAPEEIVFTSGGTESDNAAIVGAAEALAPRGGHVVISAVEHAAVEQPCRALGERGHAVTRIPVDGQCRVDAAAVIGALRPDTFLVSIVHAQNETGVLQPVAAIGRELRKRGILFHSDASQSVGKIAVDVRELQVDLLTIAGHKLYAPKGVGALVLRGETSLRPLLRGVGHERGLRPGTENVAGIVGLGAACELARRELPWRTEHLTGLRDRLEARLRARVPDLVVHGSGAERLPNTLSVALPGAPAHELAAQVEGVALAAGPACHAGRPHVSEVLRAMGVSTELALATLRLTVGRPTTPDEIDRAAERIGEAAVALRASGARR